MSKYVIMFMLLVLPSLVSADWQYTRWGMTQEEVVKASKGAAIPDPESKGHSTSEHESLLAAPYTTGGFEFTTYFLFDRQTRTLSRVDLKLKDPRQCSSLQGQLTNKYGQPEDKSEITVGWRDEAANNGIWILKIGEIACSVNYQVLKSTRNKGL